ncbi:MAG: alpha/beta fold hydrolase [Chitinivibrionales bacterium]|nr:alpha/beta fold hydrolase [Chitinivibrionales bacterium]
MQIQAIFIHGLGNTSDWWSPFLPSIEELGITPRFPDLPTIGPSLPDDWLKAVQNTVDSHDGPTVLIGHSLGASTAVLGACTRKVGNIFLLALPVYSPGIIPSAPTHAALSQSEGAAVARFVIKAQRRIEKVPCPAYFFIGEHDEIISSEYADSIIDNLHIIKNADHDLASSADSVSAVGETVAAACSELLGPPSN